MNTLKSTMPDKPNTVLVVCTANVCRSPMGAALLEHALKAEPEPLRSLKVESAGVAAYDGDLTTQNTIRALHKVNIDVTNHRSRRLTREMIDDALAVFVMTESHLVMIEQYFSKLKTPIHLFREFLPEGENGDIPDPFGSDLRTYEACRDSMVEAIPAMIKYLRTLVEPKA
ncbi:MAG: low molecular weight protein arginine phosphatase [Verrucomicrobiota bacterium]|nr:low molecular weight protein arginine phosphatase [Verrucomicrobiota bacterium]